MTSADASQAPGPAPAQKVGNFLAFILDATAALKTELPSADDPEVRIICEPVEEHDINDQGQPTMYQRFESAFYDDARQLVALWRFFTRYDRQQLQLYQSMLVAEREGLTGDRQPRKVFDRSPLGILALIAGTVTVWLTVLRTYAGDKTGDLLELFHFSAIAGTLWITGLFVVLWFILKTVRNNRQTAIVATIERALSVYLWREDEDSPLLSQFSDN